MFPFETAMFAKTFAILNVFGLNLPTELTPIQEMQYASSWHAIVALLLVCVIIAHIYIGTLGMQGAFSAMGTGEVDVNWAKEHHSLWAEEELKRTEGTAQAGSPGVAPAE
jgi:formate dehydrogenase subunit gamma